MQKSPPSIQRPEWYRLETLSKKIEGKPSSLTHAEYEEFLRLYHETLSELSAARAEGANADKIRVLNQIVLGAYGQLYRKPGHSAKTSFYRFLNTGAIAFRRQFRFIMASCATLFLFACLSWWALEFQPQARSSIISSGEEELFARWKEAKFEQSSLQDDVGMWAFYASNNPLVSVIFAAQGAGSFGIGSALGMSRTGIQLGALSYEMNTVGQLPFLLTSIAPHGASELSGAIIAGGAGYCLGWALINPGRRRRIDALKDVAKDGMALFIMAVLMMYIAAPFEGFFSFEPEFSQAFKGLVGGVVFAFWCGYWMMAGRKQEQEEAILGPEKLAAAKM